MIFSKHKNTKTKTTFLVRRRNRCVRAVSFFFLFDFRFSLFSIFCASWNWKLETWKHKTCENKIIDTLSTLYSTQNIGNERNEKLRNCQNYLTNGFHFSFFLSPSYFYCVSYSQASRPFYLIICSLVGNTRHESFLFPCCHFEFSTHNALSLHIFHNYLHVNTFPSFSLFFFVYILFPFSIFRSFHLLFYLFTFYNDRRRRQRKPSICGSHYDPRQTSRQVWWPLF